MRSAALDTLRIGRSSAWDVTPRGVVGDGAKGDPLTVFERDRLIRRPLRIGDGAHLISGDPDRLSKRVRNASQGIAERNGGNTKPVVGEFRTSKLARLVDERVVAT